MRAATFRSVGEPPKQEPSSEAKPNKLVSLQQVLAALVAANPGLRDDPKLLIRLAAFSKVASDFGVVSGVISAGDPDLPSSYLMEPTATNNLLGVALPRMGSGCMPGAIAAPGMTCVPTFPSLEDGAKAMLLDLDGQFSGIGNKIEVGDAEGAAAAFVQSGNSWRKVWSLETKSKEYIAQAFVEAAQIFWQEAGYSPANVVVWSPDELPVQDPGSPVTPAPPPPQPPPAKEGLSTTQMALIGGGLGLAALLTFAAISNDGNK